MENSKAYTILRSFSPKELSSFKKFITSPYHNESDNVIRLYEAIIKHYPSFNSRSLEPEHLYKKIFGKNPDCVKSLNNLFTRLIHLTEEFLTMDSLCNDELTKSSHLIRQYEKRGLEKMFGRKLQKIIDITKKRCHSDSLFFNPLLQFLIIDANHYFTKIFPGDANAFNNKYSEFFDTLSLSSYIRMLRALCKFTITRYWIVYDDILREKVFTLRSQIRSFSSSDTSPLIEIYGEYLKLLDETMLPDFVKLKYLLLGNRDKIGTDDFGVLLVSLIYYCNYLNKIKQNNYDEDLLELFDESSSCNPWPGYGGLNEYIFSDIVSVFLRKKDPGGAERFIYENSERVIAEKREHIVNYALSKINLYKSEAEPHLKDTHISRAFECHSHFLPHDYYGKLLWYQHEIKLYYDTDRTEEVIYRCDSYEHFLKEQEEKIPAYIFESNRAFCRFAIRLAKMRNDVNRSGFEVIRRELNSIHLCVCRNWLIRRLILFVTVIYAENYLPSVF